MSLDQVINFGKVTVSQGYDASATSVALSSGHGSRLPDPASGHYNLVWWNSTDYGDPADDPNVEVVRVTGKSSDTLTVTRGQESVSASTKNTGGKTYKMVLAITKKMIDDIDTVISSKPVTTSEVLAGSQSGSNVTLNLSGLSHTFTSVIFISRNGQILTPGDTDSGYSVSGATATAYNADASEDFVVCYTYTS